MSISIAAINSCHRIVEELLRLLGLTVEIHLRATEEFIFVDIKAQDSGMLIGHHGETLAALQSMVSLILSKELGERIHIVVDIDGYRERRESALTNMAKRAAEEVMLSKKPLTLEPMQPFERRIVHMVLQGYPEIISESEGEEPDRRIVVKPK